jgi:hypothetical protein
LLRPRPASRRPGTHPRLHGLRAALALGLGLAGHRTLHRLGNLDVLYLDGGDLDPPGLGLLVDDALQVLVQSLALSEQVVELSPACGRSRSIALGFSVASASQDARTWCAGRWTRDTWIASRD